MFTVFVRLLVAVAFSVMIFHVATMPLSTRQTWHDVAIQKIKDNACTYEEGGVVEVCYAMSAALPYGHPIPYGTYKSGGTFILMNAGCVDPKATFMFHSAFHFESSNGTQRRHAVISPESNQFQRAILQQYPNLVAYLDRAGTWESFETFVTLSGMDIHNLDGLKLCKTEQMVGR